MIPILADVTSKSDLEAAVAQVKAEVGFANVVIANSGITGPTLSGLPKDRNIPIAELQEFLWKASQEEFTDTYSVNVTAMMFTAVAFLSLLDAGNTSDKSVTKAKGIKSQFIATGSIGAYNRIPAAGFAYGGSKAAVNHVIKQLSTHLAPYHIRANVIAPGMYPSEMSAVRSP
jgi:NAD(P)-dependent dehydrogenase (short-subunit alcohol dehydrogenase family)